MDRNRKPGRVPEGVQGIGDTLWCTTRDGVDDVVAEGLALKFAVIESENDPAHHTDATKLTGYGSEVTFVQNEMRSDRMFRKDYAERVAAGKLYEIKETESDGCRYTFEVWRKLAEQDVREAQFNLGSRYLQNSESEYRRWFEEAFRNGEPRLAEYLYTLINPSVFGYGDEPEERVLIELRQACLDTSSPVATNGRLRKLRESSARQRTLP